MNAYGRSDRGHFSQQGKFAEALGRMQSHMDKLAGISAENSAVRPYKARSDVFNEKQYLTEGRR